MKKPSEIDLTGFYRFDLKTITLLLMIVGSWYDGRAQEQRRAAVDQIRQDQNALALAEQKALIKLLQVDVTQLQLDMAKLSGAEPRKES